MYAAGDEIATHEVRINDRIRAREVFLVGSDGEQLGVKPLPEALALARELSLDLVEVAPNANPPVCRVMDHGRYVYEQEQRRRQSKKKATNVVIKEMKFRPKIDEHDYTTKMKHVGPLPRRRQQGEAHDHVPGPRDGAPGARDAHPAPNRRRPRRGGRRGDGATPGRAQHDDGAAPDQEGRQGEAQGRPEAVGLGAERPVPADEPAPGVPAAAATNSRATNRQTDNGAA